MKKLLILSLAMLVLTGCAPGIRNSNMVEGRLIGTRSVNGQLVCVYGAMGSGNTGTFSGVVPHEIGGCTNNAKINMYNNDITWIVKSSRNHVQYNN